MQIIKHRKIYFAVSGFMVAASIVLFGIFGLNYGIDFTGGSLMEIKVYDAIQASPSEIADILTGQDGFLESVLVQPIGVNGYLLRFKDVTEEQHQGILRALRVAFVDRMPDGQTIDQALTPADVDVNTIQATDLEGNPVDVNLQTPTDAVIESGSATIGGQEIVEEERFESIGPTIGQELRQKSIYAILAVLVGIILYISWAFRKVSEPVSSWKYGVTAIIALAHDVMIPVGVFAVLGATMHIEVDILFVTALLTILGFSVNDTIVVFDRTRENLARSHHHGEFENTVNDSVNQTMTRSVYTSLSTFAVLLAIYIFGGDSIKYFVLALMIGIVVGTYSSIFLASPLLVEWEWLSRRKR